MGSVMTPRDLFMGARPADPLRKPEMDPLTEKDALLEARLNEVLLDAVNARAVLLFDLRGALQLRMAYTGILVLNGVERFSWVGSPRLTRRTAWNVVESVPINKDGGVNLRLLFFPEAEITMAARSAAFFAGDVPGLPDKPPDFAGDDVEVAAGMASMDSTFEPTQATSIEPLG
jgi:hypothetical protein